MDPTETSKNFSKTPTFKFFDTDSTIHLNNDLAICLVIKQ